MAQLPSRMAVPDTGSGWQESAGEAAWDAGRDTALLLPALDAGARSASDGADAAAEEPPDRSRSRTTAYQAWAAPSST